jgi:hypothetical protein
MYSSSELRRSVRYRVHLPVTVKLCNAQISARSENISKMGILLTSDSLILEGAFVELDVHFTPRLEMGPSLRARGKVLRVEPTVSGGSAVAIGCDVPFRIAPSATVV